jgi:hypothetical protein
MAAEARAGAAGGRAVAGKEQKQRIKFDTDAVTRRALRLRAVLDDVDLQDVINAALRLYLAEQIAEVVRRGLVPGPDSGEAPAPVRRKGRPGKGGGP